MPGVGEVLAKVAAKDALAHNACALQCGALRARGEECAKQCDQLAVLVQHCTDARTRTNPLLNHQQWL